MQEEEESEGFTSRNRMQENRMLAIQYMKNILNYQKNEALIKKENAETDCNQVEGIMFQVTIEVNGAMLTGFLKMEG